MNKLKATLAAGLLIASGVLSIQDLANAKTPRWLRRLDPTDRNSAVREAGRRIDPSNPNSQGGRFVRKAIPVGCGVAGAIATAPATLTAAGIVVTAGSASVAQTGCYKIIQEAQSR